MTTTAQLAMPRELQLELQSVVLLRLGDRRFAIAANQISELVAPSRIFRFPHRTSNVEGVILRRGRIVPVCAVAERLVGKKLLDRRFYLIALCRYEAQSEWVALPVTGECELVNAEITSPSEHDAAHVAGWISHDGTVIEVLNVSALTTPQEAQRATPEASPSQSSSVNSVSSVVSVSRISSSVDLAEEANS